MDVQNLNEDGQRLVSDRDAEWIQALNNWMPEDNQINVPTGGENTPVELIDRLFQSGQLKRKQEFMFGRREVEVD